MYDSVNSIDPWIGALTENHLSGKAVGPLLNAILVDQFTRIRDGDRFWFENDQSLTENEKLEIKNTKLSDVLNRNTKYTNFASDVFHI